MVQNRAETCCCCSSCCTGRTHAICSSTKRMQRTWRKRTQPQRGTTRTGNHRTWQHPTKTNTEKSEAVQCLLLMLHDEHRPRVAVVPSGCNEHGGNALAPQRGAPVGRESTERGDTPKTNTSTEKSGAVQCMIIHGTLNAREKPGSGMCGETTDYSAKRGKSCTRTKLDTTVKPASRTSITQMRAR
jgi:hypothetical protein